MRDRSQLPYDAGGSLFATTSGMKVFRLAALFAIASCGTETTSFRTTDCGDGSERTPPAAAYTLGEVAQVHVWSNGGYVGSSDEPMTHVGFEISNAGAQLVVFDSDALGLALFDKYGSTLPATRFVSVTPLGPAQIPIASGGTATLDAYFLIPVRPRVVDTMHVHWSLQIGDTRESETTTFVRDDLYPITEPPAEPTLPST